MQGTDSCVSAAVTWMPETLHSTLDWQPFCAEPMPQVATQAATGIDLADHRHMESNDAGVAQELGGQAAATVQTANGAESNATCTGPACSCRLMQHPTQQLSTHLVDHHPIEGNDAGVAQGIEGVSLLVHLCTALHAVGGVQLLDSHLHSQPAGQPHAAKLATTKLLDLCQVIGVDLLQGGRHLQALVLSIEPSLLLISVHQGSWWAQLHTVSAPARLERWSCNCRLWYRCVDSTDDQLVAGSRAVKVAGT